MVHLYDDSDITDGYPDHSGQHPSAEGEELPRAQIHFGGHHHLADGQTLDVEIRVSSGHPLASAEDGGCYLLALLRDDRPEAGQGRQTAEVEGDLHEEKEPRIFEGGLEVEVEVDAGTGSEEDAAQSDETEQREDVVGASD